MEALRPTIMAGLSSCVRAVEMHLEDAKKNERTVTKKVSNLPSKQREALDIKRQQELKNALYTFLLNKREEVALQLAINEANVRMVEYPMCTGAPISPRTNMIVLMSLVLGVLIPTAILYVLQLFDTKLKNRMGLFADFNRSYNAIINDPDRNLSLFICDIDKFKRVNDTYGHNAGDEVLKHVADIMVQNTRDCDGMYRWGGEEFIMIMTDTDMKTCAEKAETLRKVIEASECVAEGNVIKHTMSFGVTQFDPAKSIEENISDADQKLYTAKESGRTGLSFETKLYISFMIPTIKKTADTFACGFLYHYYLISILINQYYLSTLTTSYTIKPLLLPLSASSPTSLTSILSLRRL
jgi:diguanylate cyclase (GGDEF)-like protein